jgi:CheY-like chemotaxis protein
MTAPKTRSIFLADDDDDDCALFEEALREIERSIQLTTVHDGEQLMHLLASVEGDLPDVLFLDLNMPRKNGFECLAEIKKNNRLRLLNVIIFSTSLQQDVADLLYTHGAHHFIRKPASYHELKNIIHLALTAPTRQRTRENFILT